MKNLKKVFVVMLREDLWVNVVEVFISRSDAEQWVELQKEDEFFFPHVHEYWIKEKEVI